MKLGRVVYTRVETRANPDYQVLGTSAGVEELVDAVTLDGFFRALLGQPDTLKNFSRACFFAPINGHGASIWIAGIARPSDKPDRHGRRGILNYSALIFTPVQATQIAFDPWPLFAPTLATTAFPFVDDPDAQLTDFEWEPPTTAATSTPETATTALARWSGWAAKSVVGTSSRAATIEAAQTAILGAIRAGDTVLLTPQNVAATSPSSGAEAAPMVGALEMAVEYLHRALTPPERARVPFLTHSFRPISSVGRFRLLAAATDAQVGDPKIWQLITTAFAFAPTDTSTPSSSAADSAPPPTFAARRHIAVAETLPTAVEPGAKPSNQRRRHAAQHGPHPWTIKLGFIAVAIGFIAFVVARTCVLVGHATGDPPTGPNHLASSPPASTPETDESVRPPPDDPPTTPPNGTAPPLDDTDVSPEGWSRRWQRLNVWRRAPLGDAQQTALARFSETFFDDLERQWGNRADAEWPAPLGQVAAQICLMQHLAAGREMAEIEMELHVEIRAERLEKYGPILLELAVRHPQRGDMAPPGGVELRRPTGILPAPTTAGKAEKRLPNVRFTSGLALDISGKLRHDQPDETRDPSDWLPRPRGAVRVGSRLPIPSPMEWLDDLAPVGVDIFSDPDGTALRAEIIRVRFAAPAASPARFPNAFLPAMPPSTGTGTGTGD